ncbi:MAG: ABC transporter substrate-binding protein [Proteobacteria bacterium]|nr:ABC transporter substrate-binding protein [Pseudomonadota bacterium]
MMNIRVLCVWMLLLSFSSSSVFAEEKNESDASGKGDASGKNSTSESETSGSEKSSPVSSKEASQKSETPFKLPDGLVWETNDSDPTFTDPKAKKGGTFHSFLPNFPETFRVVGENSTSAQTAFPFLRNMLALTAVHPNTGRVIPGLATHWAAAKDNVTVYFKLHPDARWSDGKPVTTDDYLFSLEFKRSPHIVDPRVNAIYTDDVADLKVHAKDVISVVAGKPYPKEMLIDKVGSKIAPVPKHFHKLDKNWPKKYNYKIEPNVGPYKLVSFKKSQFLKFSRKKDWWAKDLKYFKNSYNVDHIHYKVIRDEESRWQHFVRGKLDVYDLIDPANWYTKIDQVDGFKKGYIKKIKIYLNGPEGTGGLWLNTENEHWKDPNVRHAFAHALNYAKVIEDVYRGDQVRFNAFYVNYGEFSDSSIKYRAFDEKKVSELMKASGYALNDKGVWAKDGKSLRVSVLYYRADYDQEFLLLREEAKKVGFDLTLNKKDKDSWYKSIVESDYDVIRVRFVGSDLTPPPKYWEYFLSAEADKKGGYNISKIKDKDLDKLINNYRDTLDLSEKQKLSRQILKKIHDIGPYAPRLYSDIQRLGVWRQWQLPNPPAGKRRGWGIGLPYEGVLRYIWFDEEESKKLQAYQKEGKSFDKVEITDTTYKRKG